MLWRQVNQGAPSFKVAGLRKIKGAAILLTWAPFPVKAAIFGWFVLRLGLWRGQIGVKRLRFGRRAAPLPQGKNAHDANLGALGEGKHIPNRHSMAGLGTSLAIQPQMAALDKLCGKVAPLKEARLP